MKSTPLLYLDGNPYYLDNDDLQKIANNNHGFWTKLPKTFLTDYLNNTHRLTLNKNNPWFEVEKIAVESKGSMRLKDWITFIKPVEFEKSPNWLKLMGYLLLFSGIVMVVRKGWWPVIQSSIVGLAKTVFWRLPREIIAQVWAVGLYISHWLNALLGVFIVFVLIWFSGNLDDVYMSRILLFSSILLSIGVYRHSVRFGLISKQYNKIKWIELAWGMVILSILLLILVNSINNRILQWYMFAPLLSSLYGVLPEIVYFAKSLRESNKALFETVLWSGVTLVLYVSGLANWDNMTENYYFTFGGMSAVMIWRALIEYMRPNINAHWPNIAAKIYGGSGTHYFSGFIIVLIGVAFMLMLKLEPVAEQLAIIGYYMLVVGVVLEMRTLKFDRSESNKPDSVDT
jgi:hypothetical protein